MQNKHYGIWPKNLPYSLTPKSHSVFDNLVKSSQKFPESVAVKFYGNEMRYIEIIRKVNALAGYFYHVMNIRDNDRVALFMQNSPQFMIAYYAVLAANAVIVPINPMYKALELEYILKDSNSKALIFGDELSNEVINCNLKFEKRNLLSVSYVRYIGETVDIEIPEFIFFKRSNVPFFSWDEAIEMNFAPPDHTRCPDDWCIIPYSSGTTGKPKGCLHTHKSVNATAHAYPPWIGLKERSQILATLPLYHVTGMQHSMNLPIITGSTIHMMTRWNAKTAAILIERERVQHWRSITTTMIDFLSLKNIENYDLSSLQGIGGGGAQMPTSIAERMERIING